MNSSRAPHLVQEGGAGDNLAPVLGQEKEQVVLAQPQVEEVAGVPCLPGRGIEIKTLQSPKGDLRWHGCHRRVKMRFEAGQTGCQRQGFGPAAQHRPHAGGQLTRVERLDYIIVSA